MNVSVARERAPLEAKQAGLAVGHTPPRGHGRGQTIRRLQRGLDVANKADRVASFQDQIEHEVGIIAHSCGVLEPRQLRRFHCRVVQDDGRSIPLDELYPDQPAAAALTA